MALRAVERVRAYTSLVQRSYSHTVDGARLETRNGEELAIDFGRGLTVVAGGNGAGKTSLLGAFAACLNGGEPLPSASTPNASPWLRTVSMYGQSGGESWEVTVDFTTGEACGGTDLVVDYVNPAAEAEQFITQLRSDEQPQDVLEGLDPLVFDERERAEASAVLGREYEAIRVFEVTAYSADEKPIPFFQARIGGTEYDVLGMGRGEFTALYMLWRLGRLQRRDVLLLEEPETHLAVRSQRSLMDVVVARVATTGGMVIASSHSPEFIKSVPDGSVIQVASLPRPEIRCGLETAVITKRLGFAVPQRVLAVAEDAAACAMLRELIRRFGGAALDRLDLVYHTDGESQVRSIATKLKGTDGTPWRWVVGVLDGDQRSETSKRATLGEPKDVLLLPSRLSPDHLCFELLRRWRSGEFPAWTPGRHIGETELKLLLEVHDGQERHNWLQAVSAELGGYGNLMTLCMDLLEADEALVEEAQALVKALATRCSGDPWGG